MQHCSANCPAMPSPQRVSATNGFRESGSVCYRMKNVGSCERFSDAGRHERFPTHHGRRPKDSSPMTISLYRHRPPFSYNSSPACRGCWTRLPPMPRQRRLILRSC
jgi:hypothetical protein